MANFHVSRDRETKAWRIIREGAERASGSAPTQSGAERRAKELAANSGGGEVRIHSIDGRIRDSDTVSPASDPNPPRDKRH